jgi:gliding motility-associated-like protein
MVLDSPEDEFLWLKAHNGKVKLVGNIITRDMIGCVFPVGQTCNLTMQQTMDGWNSTWAVAQAAGLKNVPKPIAGAGEIVLRPASGRIEDTRFKSSPGADLIISEAHKASAAKPLVIFVGGNVSTVANAYLKDPSIAPKIVVLQIHGYHNYPNKTVSYNTTDPWATYVVMKKFKYVNWAGDSRSWYWTPRKNVNLTQAMVNTLPNNPLANAVKTWYSRFFARESLADAPMVLYFFNNSLWRAVERRMENGQITSSDNFDYLMVSGNNWTSYGPDLINYMKDPNNYRSNPQPTPNIAPTVRLTSPGNNSQHTLGATISISATAADSDGSVSKVEFYNGGTKLGEDTSSPFNFEWRTVSAGDFAITAKAFDNNGATTTSLAISVAVRNANAAPQVSISSPSNNASFIQGASVTINAAASDSDGSITRVEFFNGTIKLGEDDSAPYSFTWKNSNVGNFSITAKAYDDKGVSTTSTVVNIIFQIANTAPQIIITSPTHNESIEHGSTVSITANASDATGSVAKVEFYVGSTKLGEDNSGPYTITWNNPTTGSHAITAKAFDDKGVSTTSTVVNIVIHVANTAPQIIITSPTHNESMEHGSAVSITANASDATGSVSKVEFYVGSTKLGEDSRGPFTITWNNPAAGSHAITAKAFDDKGLSTISSAITFVIHPANTPPLVTITSPTNNASVEFGNSISLAANASDATGSVAKVEFYSGSTRIGEDTTSPFIVSWDNAAAGNHTITAKAFDDMGLITTSSPVTLNIRPLNTAPQVAITSPSHEAAILQGTPVTITASASDALGTISKVEFYSGTTKLGEDVANPFTFVWNGAAVGDHVLTAKATDDKGLSTISSPVSISIFIANTAPTVNITTPISNAQLLDGADITIAATASDATGSVTKVEFYAGSEKLGTDNSAPYSFVWNNISAGNYSLTAKAFDDKGLSSTSAAITIVVTKANAPPTVQITSPVHLSSVAINTPILIEAIASDADGSISKVEFYNGSTELGTDTTSPFTMTWNDASPGTHSLVAKAFDNQGLAITSAITKITVTSAPIVINAQITNLTDNATFNHGSAITIAAQATVTQGQISKVEFFADNNKLGEDLTSPYSYTWNGALAGKHSLTVKATTSQQTAQLSAPVIIEVKSAIQVAIVKPAIHIVAPKANASLPIGSTVQIHAEASGIPNLTKVEFYNNNIKVGEAVSVPYILTLPLLSAGEVRIVAKAISGGIAVAATEVQLHVIGHPTAEAGEKITITLPENSATLKGAGKAADGSFVNHAWSQIDGPHDVDVASPNAQEIIINDLIEGTYIFEYNVTDSRGLVAKDQIHIEVLATAVVSPEVTLPNIPRFFTPNDDGVNDVWELPEHELFDNAVVIIFNSAGQKIYESLSPEIAWDGKLEGKPLQEDAYYYIIRMSDSIDIKGAVRIIR